MQAQCRGACHHPHPHPPCSPTASSPLCPRDSHPVTSRGDPGHEPRGLGGGRWADGSEGELPCSPSRSLGACSPLTPFPSPAGGKRLFLILLPACSQLAHLARRRHRLPLRRRFGVFVPAKAVAQPQNPPATTGVTERPRQQQRECMALSLPVQEGQRPPGQQDQEPRGDPQRAPPAAWPGGNESD